MKRSVARRALNIVKARQRALFERWKEIHG